MPDYIELESVRSKNVSPPTDFPADARNIIFEGVGKPTSRKVLSYLDLLATLISIGCFTACAIIISQKLSYATELGFNRQLVVVGFLLAAQTLCLQRVFPFSLLLIEARFGSFTLQNIEGLLRSSPTATSLGFTWRAVFLVFKLLPLGLGVGYKQFIGGVGYSNPIVSSGGFGPAAPPGLQNNVAYSLRYFKTDTGKTNAVLANTTIPFLAATDDNVPFPTNLTSPKPYGFSMILISNTSAAILDAPLPDRIVELQSKLEDDSAYHLTATNIRGTLAKYNESTGDASYWNQTADITQVSRKSLGNGYYFMLLHQGAPSSDAARFWNTSWALAGTMYNDHGDLDDDKISYTTALRFLRTSAMRFDVKRHKCEGTWKITRSSVELQEGSCDDDPLEAEHQIYDNSQTWIAEQLMTSLSDYLGGFANVRNQSHWLVPTFTTTLVAAYHSLIAGREGQVTVQTGGPLYLAAGIDITKGEWYNETYTVMESIQKSVPILRDSATLYLIIGVQPFLAVIAMCIIAVLYHVPISRDLGLISLLAGVDRDTLDMLRGAGYSGELAKPVRVRIEVVHTVEQDGVGIGSVHYRLGDSGSHGAIKRNHYYS